jgi:putative intracellular protease/amidase
LRNVFKLLAKEDIMQIAFLFYDGMTALDAIGPHEILCRLPGAKVQRIARKSGTVRTDSASLELVAEYSLEEVFHADVLVVPGAGSATTLRDYPEVLAWARLHQYNKYLR